MSPSKLHGKNFTHKNALKLCNHKALDGNVKNFLDYKV